MQTIDRYRSALVRRRQPISISNLVRASRLRGALIGCNKPVFVVASPRSGTTALCRALNEHSCVLMAWGGAPALQWIGGLAHAYTIGPTCYHYQRYTGLLPEDLNHRLRRLAFDCVWADPFRLLASAAKTCPDAPHPKHSRTVVWGSKAAAEEPAALGLEWLFPSLRFVYMIRNGIEVVHSMSKFISFRDRSFERLCKDWASYVARYEYLRHWSLAVCVRFEDFLNDPQAALTMVCSHIGIDTEPNMFKFAQTTLIHPLDGPSISANPKLVLRSRRAVHEEWSLEQKQMFQATCGPAMARLGYDMPF